MYNEVWGLVNSTVIRITMKNLPPELVNWYSPFNWDVEVLWELSGEIQKREVAALEWHLDKPFWSSVRGKGMLFDLKPRDVQHKGSL